MNKIFKCLLVAGIVAVSGYGINKSINKDTAELTGLTLANVEALADGESPDYDNKEYVIYYGMKKRFFSSNCKVKPNYTCRIRVTPIDYPDLPSVNF